MGLYFKSITRAFLVIVFSVVLSACSTIPSLMPTPAVYLDQPFDENQVPEQLQIPGAEIFYITDRAVEDVPSTQDDSNKNKINYGSRRSASLAYGNAAVRFKNKNIDWDALLRASNEAKRTKRFKYTLDHVEELGRFPASPYQFMRTENGIELTPEVSSQRNEEINKFHNQLRERLSQTQLKDVILYVHGFSNTFEKAAFTMAGLWHFFQRQGVPIIYSWPAGRGGLTGYFTDRESGEFTIFHLKETIRFLSAMPDINNIHIIAHSRGTDVTTSALRELVIENRAAGINPRVSLKIKNLVMAAPDLDFEVIQQRLMAEQFGPAIGNITIYTSRQDKALRLSQYIMSGLRFGRVASSDIELNERKVFAAAGNVDFIQVPKSRRFLGHSYFHSNPAVSADLIQLIRKDATPGSNERNLLSLGDNFWQIEEPKK